MVAAHLAILLVSVSLNQEAQSVTDWRPWLARVVGKGLLMQEVRFTKTDDGSVVVGVNMPGDNRRDNTPVATVMKAGVVQWHKDALRQLHKVAPYKKGEEEAYARWADAALTYHQEGKDTLHLAIIKGGLGEAPEGGKYAAVVVAQFSESMNYRHFYWLSAESKVVSYRRFIDM